MTRPVVLKYSHWIRIKVLLRFCIPSFQGPDFFMFKISKTKHQDKYRHYLSGYDARGVWEPRLASDCQVYRRIRLRLSCQILWVIVSSVVLDLKQGFGRTWITSMLVRPLLYELLFEWCSYDHAYYFIWIMRFLNFPDALICWSLRKNMKISFLHFWYEGISLITKWFRYQRNSPESVS